jgi:hypothetical protein
VIRLLVPRTLITMRMLLPRPFLLMIMFLLPRAFLSCQTWWKLSTLHMCLFGEMMSNTLEQRKVLCSACLVDTSTCQQQMKM